jgi:hypothetical protein
MNKIVTVNVVIVYYVSVRNSAVEWEDKGWQIVGANFRKDEGRPLRGRVWMNVVLNFWGFAVQYYCS